MNNAILVHGRPSKAEYLNPRFPTASNSHWFPWLSKHLMINNIHTIAIEVPNCYHPVYEVWKKELERNDITPNTILVGHSCGGGFILRWLCENPTATVGKVILVAPWIGYDADDKHEIEDTFFDFTWDPNLAQRTQGIVIMNSTDDMPKIIKSVNTITEKIYDIRVIEFTNKGHFTLKSLGTADFPEVLAECLR